MRVGGDELIDRVAGGWTGFDSAVSTPDLMGKVGRLGKVLGPRGLMPNPKTGTVTMDVAKAVAEIKGGKIEFRVDKNSNLHFPIGRASFTDTALAENYAAVLEEILRAKPSSAKGRYISKITMSHDDGPRNSGGSISGARYCGRRQRLRDLPPGCVLTTNVHPVLFGSDRRRSVALCAHPRAGKEKFQHQRPPVAYLPRYAEKTFGSACAGGLQSRLYCAGRAGQTAEEHTWHATTKITTVAEITEEFRSSTATVLTEYRGLSVAQLKALRRSLADIASYTVVKNTLTKRAAQEAGVEGLDELFVGPNAIAFIKGDCSHRSQGFA